MDRVCDPLECYNNGGSPSIMKTNYGRVVVELNGSTNLLSAASWPGVADQYNGTTLDFRAVENSSRVNMMDMNGDGLPDRVMMDRSLIGTVATTRYFVQFNTGAGFTGTNVFGGFTAQGLTNDLNWAGLNGYVRLIDINGDGLPDRVMLIRAANSDGIASASGQTSYLVEMNNGYGFESAITWTNVDPCTNRKFNGVYWPGYAELGDSYQVALRDVNGDGLPDRILLPQAAPYTNWLVQLNTGAGFGPVTNWGAIETQGAMYDSDKCGIQTQNAVLMDVNGDGLPDRVLTKLNGTLSDNYFVVQCSTGPVPDMLTVVSNGIGGWLSVSYKLSTQYDNHDATNGTGRQLLPFPQWTVSSLTVCDGLYPAATTTYNYEGGMWNVARREFNGFAKVTVADPLGLTNVNWFHQAGGRNYSNLGEYQDTTNVIGKKGISYRIDTIGSDGKTYKTVYNKVDEVPLNVVQHFAYISETVTLDYAGGTSAFRTKAEQFIYDGHGNLATNINYGEVTNFSSQNWTFTDIGTDVVYQRNTYAALSNTSIVDKPSQTLLCSDSGFTSVLRETLCDYDGPTGNLKQRRDRLCLNCYATNTITYDGYNNRWTETSPAGVATTTTYDTAYHAFPVQQTVGGVLTSTFNYDTRSGKLLNSTDAKGLVTKNTYDSFLRLIETDISPTPNGSATLWISKNDYGLGGMSGGASANYVHSRKNDDVDANGHETWTYSDGFSRPIQTRAEAEVGAGGGYRVTDTVYDKRGSVWFVTLPYFGSSTGYSLPTGTELGSLNQFDPVGRVTSVTSGMNGTFLSGQLQSTAAATADTGSPVGAVKSAYYDGSNPWTVVATDADNKVRKYLLDAFGRTNQIIEVTGLGNYTTTLSYDKAGSLTNVADNAANNAQYAYNTLGQMVAMADPDMGVWLYQRDYAGRIHEQTDANGQLIRINYVDNLGRVSTKQVYDFKKNNVYTITNYYDTNNGDSGFTVYPGQLYMTTDKEGWEKHSYDYRGREITTARYLSKNGRTYTTKYSYDDQDRPSGITYPNGGPTVTNIYDSGGNLSQVKQVGGTAFYSATGFDAVGHLKGITFGNGVGTTYGYYTTSKRLQNVVSTKSGTLQSLTYTYTAGSDITAITDGLYTGATGSSISSVTYDDLHRLTGLTRPVSGAVAFTYNSIGDFTVNGEAGAGTYNYGTRMPHAVKSANNKNYAYDLNGNMLVRGTQQLQYDPENHLVLAKTPASTSTFGYRADGGRLWKETSTTNGLQVWIGNIYEEKNGKTLFHIYAAGNLVCTFDLAATITDYYQSDDLHSTSILTDSGGNLTQHYEYSAYGRDRYTYSTSAFPVSQRFTSQVKDEDTGLYYYGARYYDPELGRFIQPDTIISDLGNPQTYNHYSYTLNNPLRYTDPTGHEEEDDNDLDVKIPDNASMWNTRTGSDADHAWGDRGAKVVAAAGRAAAEANPIVGTYNSGYGAIKGQDAINHEELSTAQRVVAGVQAGVNVTLPALKVAQEAKAAGTIVKDAKEAADVANTANQASKLPEGSFSISDWNGYPQGLPKPEGPFRLVEGGEYDAARDAANQANRAIHEADPTLAGKQIHEIQPVKFGGSPTSPGNKVALTPQQHAPATTWWNRLMGNVTGK